MLVKRFGLNGAGWTAVVTAVVGVVLVSRVWMRARNEVASADAAAVPPAAPIAS